MKQIVCRYAASNLEELQARLADIASTYGDHPYHVAGLIDRVLV